MDTLHATAVVVALAVLAGGCLTGLPGPSGPRGPPSPAPTDADPSSPVPRTVSVADIDVEPTDEGNLRVVATVRNDGAQSVSRVVVATVTVSGERHVRSSLAAIPAGNLTVPLVFGVDFEAFSADGTVSVTLDYRRRSETRSSAVSAVTTS